MLPELERTANTLGIELHTLGAADDHGIEDGFATISRVPASALVISADTYFNGRTEQLASLALRHKLPSAYQTRQFAAAGGLMSYGASITDAFRLAGVYAARILKGERPADLPVQQATRIELA